MAAQNVIFKLRELKPGTPAPIHLFIYFDKVRFKYSTGEKIKPELWNPETQRPFLKNGDEGLTVKLTKEILKDNEKIDFKLNEFQAAAKTYFEYFAFQREQVTPERLKEKFDKDFRPETPKKQPKQIDLNTYIDNYIKEIETGKRLTDKSRQRFTPGTIKNFKGFKVQFDNYQEEKRKRLNFDVKFGQSDHPVPIQIDHVLLI